MEQAEAKAKMEAVKQAEGEEAKVEAVQQAEAVAPLPAADSPSNLIDLQMLLDLARYGPLWTQQMPDGEDDEEEAEDDGAGLGLALYQAESPAPAAAPAAPAAAFTQVFVAPTHPGFVFTGEWNTNSMVKYAKEVKAIRVQTTGAKRCLEADFPPTGEDPEDWMQLQQAIRQSTMPQYMYSPTPGAGTSDDPAILGEAKGECRTFSAV